MIPDLGYAAEFSTPTKAKAKLELALDPSVTPLVYAVVPLVNQLDGYRPNITTERTDLFNDAAGNPQQAVNVRKNPATQTFQTVASPKNATVQAMISKGEGNTPTGHDVMARYTDANGMVRQGQAKLIFGGEQGADPQGMLIYGFTLEWARVGDPTFPTA